VLPLSGAGFVLATGCLLVAAGACAGRAQLLRGLRLLGFGLMRFGLLRVFREVPMWADFWRSCWSSSPSSGIGVGLWLFRRQLGVFGQPRPAA